MSEILDCNEDCSADMVFMNGKFKLLWPGVFKVYVLSHLSPILQK